MIALLAVVIVAGLVTGSAVGWATNKRRARGAEARLSTGKRRAGELGQSGADERLRGLPCALGDVVLLAHGEEAWLEGALLFRERAAHRDESGDTERTAAALFVAPERGGDRAVYARPAPASLDWMWPLDAAAVSPGTEPPSALEHDGERFERTCRIPLAVVAVGTGAPELGDMAILGEYEGGAGARLLVVIGSAATRVWRGRRLEPGMYEVLPGSAVSSPPTSTPTTDL